MKELEDVLEGESLEDVKDNLTDSIGKCLHGIFCSMENVFTDIARTIDGEVPSSSEWHSDLLRQMSTETSVRPPVIASSLRSAVRDLMGFRHVFRGLYGEPLRRDDVLSCLDRTCSEVVPGFLNGLRNLEGHMNQNPAPDESMDGDDGTDCDS